MNLTEDNIIDAIESYRSRLDLGNEEMANLCGMANGSVYYKWVNRKTSGGKIRYMIEFLKNTSKDINFIFPNGNRYSIPEETFKKATDKIEIYSCPECRPRVKKIIEQEDEIRKLKDEVLELHRDLKKLLLPEVKKETGIENNPQSGEVAKGNKASGF